MHLFESAAELAWGRLDVPLLGMDRDWFGAPFAPPASFSLAVDPKRLWFIAHHRKPADLHPFARPGKFQAELWKHDVAELFIADPESGRYFEFNLSPNGAWWSCEFTAPRVRAAETDIAMPEVATHADLATDGSWLAALSIPLDLLKTRIAFGPETKMNVTFILNSPDQRFLTATDLGGGQPDFHRPDFYVTPERTPLPST
ncbi:MAG: hypothetical protein V4733_08545 [Verrucomicrobiota bacterium]